MASEDLSAATRMTPQRVATAVALAAIAFVGLLYFRYTRNERSYYLGRNLRLLNLMTAHLQDVIATNVGYVRNKGLTGDPGPVETKSDCNGNAPLGIVRLAGTEPA